MEQAKGTGKSHNNQGEERHAIHTFIGSGNLLPSSQPLLPLFSYAPQILSHTCTPLLPPAPTLIHNSSHGEPVTSIKEKERTDAV
jgi:hypothetical protein